MAEVAQDEPEKERERFGRGEGKPGPPWR